MRVVAFVDLDDSLFQTARKCPDGADLTVRALDKAGTALSFATPAQEALFAWLDRTTTVVPVTGRTDGALGRVLLPFRSYRITHHGAIVRGSDGQPSGDWHDAVRPRIAQAQEGLAEAAAIVRSRAGRWGARLTTHEAEGLVTYVSIKLNDEGQAFPAGDLFDALASLTGDGGPCQPIVHGKQAAVLVRGVGKREAVELVQAALRAEGDCAFVGLGDSLSDGPFLGSCDFGVFPARSEIASRVMEPRC